MEMVDGAREDPTAVFLVERYLSAFAASELASSIARVVQVCAATGSPVPAVRYLSSVYLPSEDICFCVFRADSSDAVRDVNRRGDFGFDRITDAVLLDLPTTP